jgi:hypothetical protein
MGFDGEALLSWSSVMAVLDSPQGFFRAPKIGEAVPQFLSINLCTLIETSVLNSCGRRNCKRPSKPQMLCSQRFGL